MIKDVRHIRKKIHEIDMLIMLIHDSLSVAEDSDAILSLIKEDIAVLTELVMRLNDELNS